MERKEIIAQIEKEALEAGVSEKRLKNDVSATYLPEKGKFVAYKVANEGTRSAHLRMVADDGSSISVGTLKALAFSGKTKDAKFRKVENPESVINGGYVLTGTQPVNPQLGGKMAETVVNLLNREFTAEPVELVTMAVKVQDEKVIPYTSEVEARNALVTKRYYKVTLV